MNAQSATLLAPLRRHELPLLMHSLASEAPGSEAMWTVVRERSALASRMMRACVVALSDAQLLALQMGMSPRARSRDRRSAHVEVLRTRIRAICDEAERRRAGDTARAFPAALEQDARAALRAWRRLGHPEADLFRYLEGAVPLRIPLKRVGSTM